MFQPSRFWIAWPSWWRALPVTTATIETLTLFRKSCECRLYWCVWEGHTRRRATRLSRSHPYKYPCCHQVPLFSQKLCTTRNVRVFCSPVCCLRKQPLNDRLALLLKIINDNYFSVFQRQKPILSLHKLAKISKTRFLPISSICLGYNCQDLRCDLTQ